jgi:uncharacterized membrane protein (Fun14 family)
MSLEHLSSTLATLGGGFFGGLFLGYEMKKVVKLVAVVVGLFFAGLAYLQYQQIVYINWNKLQATSQNAVTRRQNPMIDEDGVYEALFPLYT